MRFIHSLVLLLLLLGGTMGKAANTSARLFLDSIEAKPGDTVMAAVELKHNPGWHTYWVNSGDSGYATTIKWTLPEGLKAGPIQWPVPVKSVFEGEHLYGYEGTVTLLVPITVSAEAKPGKATLTSAVDWLECEKLCIPGSAKLSAELIIGTENKQSPGAASIETAKLKLPKSVEGISAKAYWADAGSSNRTLVVEWTTTNSYAEFFNYSSPEMTLKGASVAGQSGPAVRQIRKQATLEGAAWPKEIAGVLVGGADSHDTVGFEVKLAIGEASISTQDAAPTPTGLWLQLIFGFIGGLILNVMPCVLPVLGFKILGVVNQNRDNPREVKIHGLLYGLGVWVSFLIFAGFTVVLNAGEDRFIYGSQFGNPIFLVVIITILVLVSLSLFGVFEITLSGKVMDTASKASSSGGHSGAFFNGVFATVMGVSCTAPVLGGAVGYALLQDSSLVVFLMFSAVAAGMAAPFVALSFKPAWLKFLPKPGMWMERFKIAMGFPMLATAVWLFTVAAEMFSDNLVWLGLFLVLVAAAAWVYGEFIQRSASKPLAAWITVLLLVVGGYLWALEKELGWRNPPKPKVDSLAVVEGGGIPWQPWSKQMIAKAQAEGRPVLVDFTAKWCLNCKVNKRNAIEVPEVIEKLKGINAVSLIADYTLKPKGMAAEILSHGRAGVPLVLVYPGKPGAKPEILPELFSKSTMLEALQRAAGAKQQASAK